MGSPIEPVHEQYWPLIPGLFDRGVPEEYLPLSFAAVNDAYRIGLLSRAGLSKLIQVQGAVLPAPSELLITVLRPSWIERERDVEEELRRLASQSDPRMPSLWMILARMILQHYSDAAKILMMLQFLFDKLGGVPELAPFTMYGSLAMEDGSQLPMSEKIARLDLLLQEHGV